MQKILKHFNLKIPVEFSTDYAVQFRNSTDEPMKIFVQHPDTERTLMKNEITLAQDAWTRIYLSQHGIKMSYHAFAMLHEIGHTQSHQRSLKEYDIDVKTLEMLAQNGLIDVNEYINLYNKIEDEKNASEWAVNWIKNNKKTAEWLNSIVN